MIKLPDLTRVKTALGISRGLPLDEVFSYSSPVWDSQLFFPREQLRRQFMRILSEPGTQPLLYGESQVGKTSLILHCLREGDRPFQRLRSAYNMTGDVLLAECLGKLSPTRVGEIREKEVLETKVDGKLTVGIAKLESELLGKTSEEKLLRPWRDRPSVGDLVHELNLSGKIFVLDDVERLKDLGVQDLLGDMAKGASEMRNGRQQAAKFVFSCVAKDRDELPRGLRNHSNRTRSLMVPKMSHAEIRGLVIHGMIISLLNLSESVVDCIVQLSRGIPARAKLICLECGRAILEEEGLTKQRLTGNERLIDLVFFDEHIQSEVDSMEWS